MKFPPSNEDVRERASLFDGLFKKYENCGDEDDEGYEMDDLIAMADAQESPEPEDYDEEIVDPEKEAYEDSEENSEEYNKHLELIRTPGLSRAEQFERLSYFFDANLIREFERQQIEREREVARMNLPFWNM